jgi:hypothetical protein
VRESQGKRRALPAIQPVCGGKSRPGKWAAGLGRPDGGSAKKKGARSKGPDARNDLIARVRADGRFCGVSADAAIRPKEWLL